MKILLAQIAPRVGDIPGNTVLALAALRRGEALGCALVVLPELSLTGYPPEDLLLRPSFLAACEAAVAELIAATGATALLFGHPHRQDNRLFNSATLARHGGVAGRYDKQSLPNYGVFDERRYFTPGNPAEPMRIDDHPFAVRICEDHWDDAVATAVGMPTVTLNASPFHLDKQPEREAISVRRARQSGAPQLYVNAVGGQDEVVFDGGSHVLNGQGALVARAPLFAEHDLIVDLQQGSGEIAPLPSEIEQLHRALIVGIRDYVLRNGCTQVVIGLSGGIDSALVAALAAEALGSDAVLGVLLPSRYSSDHSLVDAEALADNLGIETATLPIAAGVATVEEQLAPLFALWGKSAPDVTEENIQARLRGLLLMAISNKTGRMLLTTGNKSEMAVGYSTLYGDMAGGFAPLKDLYKGQVFALARHLNALAGRELIPHNTLVKPPSAELRPDQKDSDSLPEYDRLDAILEAAIEGRQSVAEIAAAGFDADEVQRIFRLLHAAEYKRRQSPPGIKVTTRAFGRDRRYPITHGFRD